MRDTHSHEDGQQLESAGAFAGVPDEFQRLWTPHRMVYISDRRGHHDADCPFCRAPSLADEEALIVARGEHAYVLLNLYPYASGHILVCPYRHVASYDDATHAEIGEIATLTQTAMRVITAVARNDGFNVEINQGAVAGAGIAHHLHQHVVPRWSNDSNFMPIIAKTKNLPTLLGDVRASISSAWPK